MITRSRIAGLTMLSTGLTYAAAPEARTAHEIATAILIVGGAMLALINDERCKPKMDQFITALIRLLDRRRAETVTGRRRRRDHMKDGENHG
jgi:hypothetical protein